MAEKPSKTAVVRRGGKRSSQEWDDIRATYVNGIEDETGKHTHITLAQLAMQYGLSLDTLKRHSMNDKWGEQRKDADHKRSVERREKRQKDMIAAADRGDDVMLRIAEMGLHASAHNLQRMFKERDELGRTAGPVAAEAYVFDAAMVKSAGDAAAVYKKMLYEITGQQPINPNLTQININQNASKEPGPHDVQMLDDPVLIAKAADILGDAMEAANRGPVIDADEYEIHEDGGVRP